MPEANQTLTSYAKELRRNQTDAERVLWMRLRARQVNGLKFRRQHPIGCYITDFCCPEKHLVIEVDGGQHTSRTFADKRRTEFLAQQGYWVLRYWNHDVLTDPEAVLQHIINAMNDPHPLPLPIRARGIDGELRPRSACFCEEKEKMRMSTASKPNMPPPTQLFSTLEGKQRREKT